LASPTLSPRNRQVRAVQLLSASCPPLRYVPPPLLSPTFRKTLNLFSFLGCWSRCRCNLQEGSCIRRYPGNPPTLLRTKHQTSNKSYQYSTLIPRRMCSLSPLVTPRPSATSSRCAAAHNATFFPECFFPLVYCLHASTLSPLAFPKYLFSGHVQRPQGHVLLPHP
jgi:hypothetical protein